MPELPEVEAERQRLAYWLSGRRAVAVDVLDRKLLRGEAGAISGALLESDREAKYLILHFETGSVVLHLGMTGRLRFASPAGEDPPYSRLRLALDDGSAVRLTDPRRFARAWIGPRTAVVALPELSRLGPDAWKTFPDAAALARICDSRSPVKLLLLDQQRIGGLGNICTCEALFLAGIHPARPGRTLSAPERERLAAGIRRHLAGAIEMLVESDPPYLFEGGKNAYRVYGRTGEPCPGCGRPIERIVLGGRGTWFCPGCQPRGENGGATDAGEETVG